MEYYHSLINLKHANMAFKLKSAADFSLMMLKILEQMLTWGISEKPESVSMPYLYVDTTNLKRAFIVKSGQIISFAFPFSVYEKKDCDEISINHRSTELTTEIISKATSIGNDYKKKGLYTEIAMGLNLYEPLIAEAASLFELILSLEPSYIRYDYDKKSSKGQLHPTYHFDVNYSKTYTYKLGLYKPVSITTLVYMLNQTTKCSYVNSYYTQWYSSFKRKVKSFLRRK